MTGKRGTGRTPVVFLHGIRVSGTMWRLVAERVRETREVSAPDMPGHGVRRGERFTVEAATDVVRDEIDALGGRALVVGLSMGGFLGIGTAGRYPERVAGLVAMGCTTRGGMLIGVYRAMARVAVSDPRRADRVSERVLRRVLPPRTAAVMTEGGIDCSVVPDVVGSITQMDALGHLASYPGPVWLVNGSRDHFRRHEREFLQACRNGRLQVWPGCNHWSCLADVDRLVRLIDDACAVTDRSMTPGPRGGGD
jgi:pimeloyl-ACP methyl ester carboxylesterase